MRRLLALLARFIAQPKSWLRAVSSRRRFEDGMEAELGAHVELLTADLVRGGLAPEEAARQARVALGPAVTHKDQMRAAYGLRWLDDLSGDLRYGARRLRGSVGFTAVTTISLALAIGANTTIFSMAKQILFERLAVPHAGELRLLGWNASDNHRAIHSITGEHVITADGRFSSSSFSFPVYQQMRAQNRVMQDLFAFKGMSGNGTIAGEARRVGGELVTGNYFRELGVEPVLGRLVGDGDDVRTRAGAVTDLSYGVWQREYGGSPKVLGQVIKLNEVPLMVIGVTPRGFTGAYSTLQSPDVFVPMSMQPLVRPGGHAADGSMLTSDREWWVNVMARVGLGVSDSTALASMDAQLNAAAQATMPVRQGEDLPKLEIRDGSQGLFLQSRSFMQPMRVLMTMVGFVLLLACANIANLMLARGSHRQREMSVRVALGAGRSRIIRQMLVESLMLAMLGGIGGVMLGYLGSSMAHRLTAYSWQQTDFRVHFDWKVWAFTIGITLATGILFGLAPALAAARVQVNSGLKETAQSMTRRRRGWGGRSLVGFQIALSTLLVIGAGLFLRTLAGLNSVNVGFRTDHLLLAQVSLPPKEYAPGKDIEFHTRVLEAVAALPGVESAAPATSAYIANNNNSTDFRVEGINLGKDADDGEVYTVVGNNFFSTLQIPIVAGRSFGSQDSATSQKVGVINARLAKKRFGDLNPLGRYFYADGQEHIQIVGICADTRYDSLRNEPPPQFFLPFVQQKDVSGGWTYEVRTSVDPLSIVPLMRKAVQQLDSDMPLINVRTQDEQIESTTQTERTFVALTSGFGGLALVLAAVGIYGVMAYSVMNRTNEIGIRLALGARREQVMTMVLGEAAWVSLTGIGEGLVAALLLGRLVKSMLYGLQPADPISLSGGALLLILIALAASWIPARRAAGVQPMEALRHE